MRRVYACLVGQWIDITDSATINGKYKPLDYFSRKTMHCEDSLLAECFRYDYIDIHFEKKIYRISPTLIQFVEEY